jgi:hypothetical protein
MNGESKRGSFTRTTRKAAEDDDEEDWDTTLELWILVRQDACLHPSFE